MAGILLEWSQFGDFESFEVYRSDSPFDETTLPSPLATGLNKMYYWDASVVEGNYYYYRVATISGGARYLTSLVSKKSAPLEFIKGLWFSAYAGASGDIANNPYNPDGNKTAEWLSNFGEVTDFSLISFKSGIGTSTPTMSGKLLYDVDGLKFLITSSNGAYTSDQVAVFLEFLNSDDNVVFSFRVSPNGNYGVYVRYGGATDSIAAPTSGYPQLNGELTFTNGSVKYKPLTSTNYVREFTFNCNTTSIVSCRVSGLYARSGSSARTMINLKCLGYI